MIDEEEGQEEIIQQDDLSTDLAAAWEEEEESDDGESGVGSEEASDDTTTASTEDAEAEVDGSVEAEVEVPQSGDIDAAPESWSPAAREVWKDVPAEAKAYIAQREQQMSEGIQKYAQGAKRAAGMDQTLAPFQQYTSMNGGPGAAIKGLLETGSMLQMGSPQQKAQIVAQLIGQFGVDISALDNMLVGNAPSEESQQQSAVQQAVQQAVAPYQQSMDQLNQQQNYQRHQQQQAVVSEVNDFGATHEFYKDVRGDMANILDSAAATGRKVGMEEAYTMAVNMHPQIAPIVAARNNASAIAGKRKAASSISGTQGGPGGGSQVPDDLTAQLNAAWDHVGTR